MHNYDSSEPHKMYQKKSQMVLFRQAKVLQIRQKP